MIQGYGFTHFAGTLPQVLDGTAKSFTAELGSPLNPQSIVFGDVPSVRWVEADDVFSNELIVTATGLRVGGRDLIGSDAVGTFPATVLSPRSKCNVLRGPDLQVGSKAIISGVVGTGAGPATLHGNFFLLGTQGELAQTAREDLEWDRLVPSIALQSFQSTDGTADKLLTIEVDVPIRRGALFLSTVFDTAIEDTGKTIYVSQVFKTTEPRGIGRGESHVPTGIWSPASPYGWHDLGELTANDQVVVRVSAPIALTNVASIIRVSGCVLGAEK